MFRSEARVASLLSLLVTALAFRETTQTVQLRRASGPPGAAGSWGHVGAADGYRGALASPAAVPTLALRGGGFSLAMGGGEGERDVSTSFRSTPPHNMQLSRATECPGNTGCWGHVGSVDGYRGALALRGGGGTGLLMAASVALMVVSGIAGGGDASTFFEPKMTSFRPTESVERFSFPGRAGVKTVCVAGDWNGWVASPPSPAFES
ncbi:hypothetical protein T484DRAFT_1829105 [Baffinella frigidus]|nr:hypothetical protein T484DRAFT_1829105 [Cryptophyta sp. CCMP2293]